MRGLRAELNTQSFVTGQSQIDLDFDQSAPAVMHPNVTSLPEIPTRLSTIQRVQKQLSQLPLRGSGHECRRRVAEHARAV